MLLDRISGNTASICKIEIASIDDVETTPDVLNGAAIGQVVLKSGKNFDPLYFTTDTAHWVERPVVINGVEMHESIVKWRVPKDDAERIALVNRWKKMRIVAVITDLNKERVLMGSIDEPARFVHTLRDRGQAITDSNHINVEIKVTRSTPAGILPA